MDGKEEHPKPPPRKEILAETLSRLVAQMLRFKSQGAP
jgi:hypothetical protein